MRPVLTAQEMASVDEAAQKSTPIDQLIARAGFAVATHALVMLGGSYGRRVVVVAGKGHNGDDGCVAASVLSRRGIKAVTFRVGEVPSVLPPCDLVIDAAYGTGFHGSYAAPTVPPGIPVLAVDIPSGLHADSGIASNGAVRADATVTFGALKPGLLLHDGPTHCGELIVADIGLPIGPEAMALIEDGDLREVPPRRRDGNKWDHAVFAVAGSPGMMGAALLVTSGAMRAGAGMVRLGSPGLRAAELPVGDAVAVTIPKADFASMVVPQLGRCKALVIGPGLGTKKSTAESIRATIAATTVPTVIDADALNALAAEVEWRSITRSASASLVLTPHEGEFSRLTGRPIDQDRVREVRILAGECGATVLLKGSPTLVASKHGVVAVINSGSERLSTAGSGDVLSGVIAALVARGLDPFRAAALGAHVHGRAASLARTSGLVASDLPRLIALALDPRAQRHFAHHVHHGRHRR